MSREVVLYSFWRSSCAWRVRIALHWKEIPHTIVPINLFKEEHLKDNYASINPSKKIPALRVDGKIHTESYAILELLEEQFSSDKKLLPDDPYLRSRSRAMALHVISGIQPLQSLGVLNYISNHYATKGDVSLSQQWAQYWITKGLSELETMSKETYNGRYAVGNSISMADVVIVPQLYLARQNKVDTSQFTTLSRIEEACFQSKAFQDTHPEKQVDYPEQ